MKPSERKISVSCIDCIYIRRLSTCHKAGHKCTECQKPCCCRKCIPDVSGNYRPYEERRFFCVGIPIIEYSKKNYNGIKSTIDDSAVVAAEKSEQSIADNLDVRSNNVSVLSTEEDKNGQLSFCWNNVGCTGI